MIRIGTSGYSFEDWVGPFYPEDIDKSDFLSYFSQRLKNVEVNYTYYRLPVANTLANMEAKTPEGFMFTLKATGTITHEQSQNPQIYEEYRSNVQPIIDAGKFGCVLMQFPNSFHLEKQNVNHLAFIRQQWPDLPLAVEFRHKGWMEDERTFEFLQDQNMAYCCVDQPQFSTLVPPIARATADIAYVRFHGRNYEKWWQHEQAWERYDYLYSRDELKEWVDKVKKLDEQAETTYVFFNNHYNAQAVQNAMEFADLLEK